MKSKILWLIFIGAWVSCAGITQAQVGPPPPTTAKLPCGGPPYGWDQPEWKRLCMLRDSAKGISETSYKVESVSTVGERSAARAHLRYLYKDGSPGNQTFLIFRKPHPDYQQVLALRPGQPVKFTYVTKDQDPAWGRDYPVYGEGGYHINMQYSRFLRLGQNAPKRGRRH